MKANLFTFLAAVVLVAACQDKAKTPTPAAETEPAKAAQAKTFKSSSVKAIDPVDVDPSQTISGEMVEGITWEDKNGQNTVVLTEKHSDEEATASLQAFQYVHQAQAPRQLWKMNDGVEECEFDIVCRYIKESLVVTDLDKDNTGEVWFVYYLACKSDVSPSIMKLMMYEGGKKYVARGETLVDSGGGQMHGGEMVMDAQLKAAGNVFTDFAQKHWKKHMKETF